MMRSLYSGVTGLRNHQTRMDVIGNNIANVNTVGFKASRVTFNDIYSETIRTGSSTNENTGGQNPMQIGLGMAVSSIDVMHGRAAAQLTSMPLDVSIAGDGFFTVSTVPGATPADMDIYYTRAGNFSLDAQRTTDDAVLGPAGSSRLLDANGNFVIGYMLDENGANQIGINPDPPQYDLATGEVTGWEPEIISIDFDLYDNVSIDANGAIVARRKPTGADEEGTMVILGWLCISTFSNPTGLQKEGSNLYSESPASGAAQQHIAGSAATNAGKLTPGTLEMSNVDIAAQFTDMIVTQRGFQANSRIITVSDQMLEELVNIKR